MGNNKPGSLKFAVFTGAGAFLVAVFFSIFSEILLPKLQILILSFFVLLLVIFIGIIFDMIGVAAAVADERAFHAKASKKLKGASHSLFLIKHADKVATFCNDVVGDICGTVSGAFGVAIGLQVVTGKPDWNESILTMIMTGLVASLTVGGKAAGKKTAMDDSEQIIYAVGRIIAWFESVTGIRIIGGGQRKGKDRRR
ncbi:MAG: hypothetical protein CVU89_09915 [Firmicutes bacterium HGW-Firmicutes-14]|nr:MAG: hypothetical protein CVU89_09915 [Firmicutes bacterium HGW-Firmicutes-14]